MADIQLKYFLIRASGDPAQEEELNRFLRSHQVLDFRQEFVAEGINSVWCVAVRYAQSGNKSGGRPTGSERASIDYKDELEPEAFACFVELRKRRKAIAEADGLPAFAVFTDKELAEIAKLNDPTLEQLQTVKGVGGKKVERFGRRILNQAGEIEDEASRPTD